MLERNFSNNFSLQNACKEFVNVQGMAAETEAMIAVVNEMTENYVSAMKAGFQDEPKSAMLKIHEEKLNIVFEKTINESGLNTRD